MNEHIKEIQLETETKKEKYIQELSESCSFVTTHGVIAMLKDLSGWTDDQIEELCSIAINNNQVGWILSDPDVHLFYKTILTQKKDGFLENSFSKEVLDIINEYENK